MSLRHTLLAILDWVPLHGYALKEASRGYSWLHPMSNANIYPALRQLEEEGFVVHRQEVVDGRLRKIYSITPAGQAELRRWLGDPTEQGGVYRDPGLLKICLLRPGCLEPARAWIERDRDRIVDEIASTEAFLDERADRIPKYSMLVARHGLDLARLRADFLGSMLEEIDRDLEAEGARQDRARP